MLSTNPSTAANPLTVLIVDTDDHAVSVLSHMVEAEGHIAVTLTDPERVFHVMGEIAVDVLLCDQRIGGDILKAVSRLHPHTFRAMMSASLVADRLIDIVNDCRIEYLLRKPFHVEEVRGMLRGARLAAHAAEVAPLFVARAEERSRRLRNA